MPKNMKGCAHCIKNIIVYKSNQKVLLLAQNLETID